MLLYLNVTKMFGKLRGKRLPLKLFTSFPHFNHMPGLVALR